MNIRQLLSVVALFLASIHTTVAITSEDFRDPYDFNAKPWCFWYWMHGAVSKEGITADLEAMSQNGLAGAYLMPIKSIEANPSLGGTVRQLSPEWYEMVDWAMQECDRLNLKLGMHICDGFALAGGPWIKPEESMQRVAMTEVDDTTGVTIGYYSIPARYLHGESFFGDIVSTKPDSIYPVKVEGKGIDLKIDTLGGGFSAKQPCTVDYDLSTAVTVSALELELPSTQFQAQRLDVYASDNGISYHHVKQLVPARTGWQNYDYNTTHSIPTTTAQYWRFKWDPAGTEPGSEDLDQAKWSPSLKVKRIIFHPAPHINQWEGKAGLVWRISSKTDEALIPLDYIPLKDVRQISSLHNIKRNDLKNFNFRLASVSTGQVNATGGDGKGLECDKFNRSAIKKQLDRWFNSHFTAPVPGREDYEHQQLAQRVLKYMHVDSWECGSQNWSGNFAEEFRKRRGYSIMPYLPMLVGFPLESQQLCDQVLRDVRITISELINDIFFDELRRNALLHDCQLSAESVCPTMVSDGMSHYRYADLPMGEFWLNSPTHDKINDMLDAISGGHIYGKRIIQAEGFTELRGTFNEDPAMLKPVLDRNFCLGINRLFYHVCCLTPDPKLRPGMTLDGIGLFFQHGNTWYRESAEFTRYVTRCQYLLQQGRPVVDLAVFTGQEIPRRAFQPDRLVPMLPGIFGNERVESERKRLANEGVPVVQRPVGVKYNANVLTPEQWINPLRGYQYDSFNEDALMRCRVFAGRISMESIDDAAPAYRALILPMSHKMDPDTVRLSAKVLARIDDMERKGAVVIRPEQLPWTDETFRRLHIMRDVDNLPDGIAYCHRTTDDAEIYFLSNQNDSLVNLRPSFRDGFNRQPELWDPLDGSIRMMDKEVTLQPYGSVFVVFPVSPTPEDSLTTAFIDAGRSKSLQPLDSLSWQIRFHETDATILSDTLPDWSQNKHPDIRYYSGRATYRSEFMVNEATSAYLAAKRKQGRIYLRLNTVANIATVRMNGYRCGMAWTSPYEVDVTDALSGDNNLLEIDVVNTWSNAIQGHDEGQDPFPNIWTNARYRKAEKELLPSGLLGPLELIIK